MYSLIGLRMAIKRTIFQELTRRLEWSIMKLQTAVTTTTCCPFFGLFENRESLLLNFYPSNAVTWPFWKIFFFFLKRIGIWILSKVQLIVGSAILECFFKKVKMAFILSHSFRDRESWHIDIFYMSSFINIFQGSKDIKEKKKGK